MLFKSDLVLFHAPSVYDFRNHDTVYGPIADVIPSSTVFDMYPIGLTSIADYLEKNGYKVQIVNLASRMLNNKNFDVEKTIAKSKARFFGIDLHWLPHIQGSIEIAKIIKKYHPDKKVIMGGLTASYFHKELMENYHCIDYIIRGDSVEEPFYQLTEALTKNTSSNVNIENIPNLTYRKKDSSIVVNKLEHVPATLDDVNIPSYKYVLKSVLKYGKIRNLMPFADWLDYPITLLLTSRGCNYNCVICGGGKSAYKKICNRREPAFRSPARLIEDVKVISSFSNAPIFVVHDLRQGGKEYAKEFFERLANENIENEFIFELFKPADDGYFKLINNSVSRYSLQVSIESHVEEIRKTGGKFSRYNNDEVAKTLKAAYKNGCQNIDLFFIIGLPKQNYSDAVGCVNFTRELYYSLNKELGYPVSLKPFAAPYAPFLDPGSIIYEDPGKFGYVKLWDDLEDYKKALMAPSWKYMLNYETKWLTREDIIAATFDTAHGLNELKREMKIIDKKNYENTKNNLKKSRITMSIIDNIVLDEFGKFPKEPISIDASKRILKKAKQLQEVEETEYILCGKEEMRWPIKKRFKNFLAILKFF